MQSGLLGCTTLHHPDLHRHVLFTVHPLQLHSCIQVMGVCKITCGQMRSSCSLFVATPRWPAAAQIIQIYRQCLLNLLMVPVLIDIKCILTENGTATTEAATGICNSFHGVRLDTWQERTYEKRLISNKHLQCQFWRRSTRHRLLLNSCTKPATLDLVALFSAMLVAQLRW